MAKTDQEPEKDFLDIDLDDALDDASVIKAAAAPERKIEAPTGVGVLVYDNKKYAVGLKWLVAEDDSNVELAIKRAKGFKADFYCMRQNVVVQHGFAFLGLGHRVGLPALASVVGDVLVGEWHGVFVADNGWWYLAVHADNISPDGDRFFTSEEEAYNHFITQAESHRWPRSYAPESWNLQETNGEIPLSKIIGEAPAPALKPVTLDAIFSGKRNKNLAVVAGLIVLALLGVSLLGQQLLPSLIPTQAQLPVPNVSVSDNLQAPPKEPIILDEAEGAESITALKLSTPSQFIAQCLDGFSKISIPLPGWTLGSLRCKETFVESSWKKMVGSFEMVEPYLERFPNGTMRSFVDASTFMATHRLAGKPAQQSVPFLAEAALKTLLNKRFSNLGEMSIKNVNPATAQELLAAVDMMQQAGFGSVGQSKPNLRPLGRDDLPYLELSLKSRTPPNLIAPYFDLPGLIIVSMEGEIMNGFWVYNAKVIIKPDKRLVEANNKAITMQIR